MATQRQAGRGMAVQGIAKAKRWLRQARQRLARRRGALQRRRGVGRRLAGCGKGEAKARLGAATCRFAWSCLVPRGAAKAKRWQGGAGPGEAKAKRRRCEVPHRGEELGKGEAMAVLSSVQCCAAKAKRW